MQSCIAEEMTKKGCVPFFCSLDLPILEVHFALTDTKTHTYALRRSSETASFCTRLHSRYVPHAMHQAQCVWTTFVWRLDWTRMATRCRVGSTCSRCVFVRACVMCACPAVKCAFKQCLWYAFGLDKDGNPVLCGQYVQQVCVRVCVSDVCVCLRTAGLCCVRS